MTASLNDIIVFTLFIVGSIFFWLFTTLLEKEKNIFSKYINALREEQSPFVSEIDNSKSYKEERNIMLKAYIFLGIGIFCYILATIV